MRKTKIIFYISALAILMSSCSRKWLDVNDDPNNPTSARADLVFTNAARVTAGTLAPNQLGEFWAGHWGHSTSFMIIFRIISLLLRMLQGMVLLT
jgi:hypothetical protein